MSNATVNNYVKQACRSLQEQLEDESSVRNAALASKDSLSNIQQAAGSYVRHIIRFRKLEAAYDQMVHPQKRLLLRELLLAVMGRLLEMKHKLAGLECRDYHNFADELVDFKLSPEDIEIPVPRFFTTDRLVVINENRGLLDSLNAKRLEASIPPQVPETMETTTAIRIIQTSERVRQAMVRAKYMRDIKLQAARESDFGGHEEQDIVGRAALKIQKVFRGYRTRQIFMIKRQEEDLFLRMVGPNSLSPPVFAKLNDSRLFKDDQELLRSFHERRRSTVRKEENEARRKGLQKQFAEEYAQGLVAIRDKIKNNEGPELKEALQDDFRHWYLEFKKETGKYP